MIRFSAALVVVAIGVLIGGIVASDLLLVYIAIALSAVALVALAAGVVLKREELFGEGQELAPAQAGASPGLPGRSGEVSGHVTPPPLQGAAVGPGAAFAAPGAPVTPPAPPRPVSAPPVSAQSATTREPKPGRDSWGAPPAAAPVFGTWQAPAPSGASPGWGTGAPSVFAPRTADTTAAASAAGQATAPPSWFNPADRAASPDVPATTQGPGAGGGWSWLKGETVAPDPVGPNPGSPDPAAQDSARPDTVPPVTGKPNDAAPLDDDWPTRYSWLDDEPEEDGGSRADSADGADATAEDGPATPADAAYEGDAPDSGGAVSDTAAKPVAAAARASVSDQRSGGDDPGDAPDDEPSWPSPAGAPTVAAPAMAAPTVAAPTVSAAAAPAVPGTKSAGTSSAASTGTALSDPVRPDPELSNTGLSNTGAAEPADPETVESPALDLARDPDPTPEADGSAGEPEGEASATSAGLVSVVRGVPRFHREDCVLIRFMPEGDTQKMPAAQAREAGCTPCTACEPEG